MESPAVFWNMFRLKYLELTRLMCLEAQLGRETALVRLAWDYRSGKELYQWLCCQGLRIHWWSFSVCRNVSRTHAVKEALVSSSHLPSVHMATVAKIARQGILPVRANQRRKTGRWKCILRDRYIPFLLYVLFISILLLCMCFSVRGLLS